MDSKTGIVEWAVTDYHYRELWYKFESKMENILVWIFPNFHTPRFLNIKTKGLGELKDIYRQGTQLNKIWKIHVEKKSKAHPKNWVKPLIGKGVVSGIIAEELGKLWWDYWRYPLGADNENYKIDPESPNKKVDPTIGKQPSSK